MTSEIEWILAPITTHLLIQFIHFYFHFYVWVCHEHMSFYRIQWREQWNVVSVKVWKRKQTNLKTWKHTYTLLKTSSWSVKRKLIKWTAFYFWQLLMLLRRSSYEDRSKEDWDGPNVPKGSKECWNKYSNSHTKGDKC